jgi:hypothetical protein
MEEFEAVRSQRVELALTEYVSDEPGSGEFELLLGAVTKAVKAHAAGAKATSHEFVDLLDDAIDLVVEIRYAVQPGKHSPLFGRAALEHEEGVDASEVRRRRLQNVWSHKVHLLYEKTSGDSPDIDRSGLELACSNYLSRGWRCKALDRVFVDALVASELIGYGDEMLNKETFGIRPQSPLKQPHVLIRYLRAILLNAMLAGLAIGVALWVDEEWASWAAAIVVGLLAIYTILLTVFLPFAWRRQSAARKAVRELLSAMNAVYLELETDGPISASHIYKRLEDTTTIGVVWPASVYSMLDDVLAREGRF